MLSLFDGMNSEDCDYYEKKSRKRKSFINHFYNFILADLTTILILLDLNIGFKLSDLTYYSVK